MKTVKYKENNMKAKEVMELLDISRRTLTRYITKGVIKGNRLPTGRYIYDDESVYKLAGEKKYTKEKEIDKSISLFTEDEVIAITMIMQSWSLDNNSWSIEQYTEKLRKLCKEIKLLSICKKIKGE